jgi:hypothetical protein
LLVIVPADAEDVIDVADDGMALGVGEFALGILEELDGFASFGAGFAVLLQHHRFAAGARQGVHEADEGSGIAAQTEIEGGAAGGVGAWRVRA